MVGSWPVNKVVWVNKGISKIALQGLIKLISINLMSSATRYEITLSVLCSEQKPPFSLKLHGAEHKIQSIMSNSKSLQIFISIF